MVKVKGVLFLILSIFIVTLISLVIVSSIEYYQLPVGYQYPQIPIPNSEITVTKSTTYLPSDYPIPTGIQQSSTTQSSPTATNSYNDVVKPIPENNPIVTSNNLPPIPSADIMNGPERICNDKIDNDKNGFTDCKDSSCNNQPTKDIGPWKAVCCNGVSKTEKSMQTDANNCGGCGQICGKYKTKLGFNAQYACKSGVCDRPKITTTDYNPPVVTEQQKTQMKTDVKTTLSDESKKIKDITQTKDKGLIDKLQDFYNKATFKSDSGQFGFTTSGKTNVLTYSTNPDYKIDWNKLLPLRISK